MSDPSKIKINETAPAVPPTDLPPSVIPTIPPVPEVIQYFQLTIYTFIETYLFWGVVICAKSIKKYKVYF